MFGLERGVEPALNLFNRERIVAGTIGFSVIRREIPSALRRANVEIWRSGHQRPALRHLKLCTSSCATRSPCITPAILCT
jgi:hypothetical protein